MKIIKLIYYTFNSYLLLTIILGLLLFVPLALIGLISLKIISYHEELMRFSFGSGVILSAVFGIGQLASVIYISFLKPKFDFKHRSSRRYELFGINSKDKTKIKDSLDAIYSNLSNDVIFMSNLYSYVIVSKYLYLNISIIESAVNGKSKLKTKYEGSSGIEFGIDFNNSKQLTKHIIYKIADTIENDLTNHQTQLHLNLSFRENLQS